MSATGSLRRLIVPLLAVLVAGLASEGHLLSPLVRQLEGITIAQLGLFKFATSAPAILVVLWALLSDGPAARGGQRGFLIVIGGGLLALAWGTFLVVPRAFGAWVAVGGVVTVAMTMINTTAQGIVIEIGRDQPWSGGIAALWCLVGCAADLLRSPQLALIARWPDVGTGACGLILGVVTVVLGAQALRDRPPTPDVAAPARVAVGRYLRSSALWSVIAIAIVVRMSALDHRSVVMALVMKQVEITAETETRLTFIVPGAQLAAYVVYALVARRLVMRDAIRLAFGAHAVATLLLFAAGSTVGGAFEGIMAMRGLGVGLATVALVHLVLQTAPRGREALAAVMVTLVAATGSSVLLTPLMLAASHANLSLHIAIAAGAATLGALLATALPARLFHRAE